MKKRSTKVIISILLVLTLALALSACGGGSGGDPIKGKWEGTSDDGIVTNFTFDGKGGLKTSNEYGFEATGTYRIGDDDFFYMQIENWDEENRYAYEVGDGKLVLTNDDESYRPNYTLEKK